MSLENICKSDVVTVTRDKSLEDTAKLMRDHSIGDVVVVDEKNVPCGLVTDRDIVVGGIAEKGSDIRNLKVSDLMSSDVVCANIDDSPFDVAKQMRDNGVARMPVVDKNGRLCGIVTAGHLFKLINGEFSTLLGISTHHREATSSIAGASRQRGQKERKGAQPSDMDRPTLQ